VKVLISHLERRLVLRRTTVNKVTVTMNRDEWIAVLRCIRRRQDECRYIKEDDPTYPTFHALDLELEGLKMRLANQVPSADKFSK